MSSSSWWKRPRTLRDHIIFTARSWDVLALFGGGLAILGVLTCSNAMKEQNADPNAVGDVFAHALVWTIGALTARTIALMLRVVADRVERTEFDGEARSDPGDDGAGWAEARDAS